MAKLERELVLVDAKLEAALGDTGGEDPLEHPEAGDVEPVEPVVLRVVAASDDAAAPLPRLAFICAPRAAVASDVVVGAFPAYAVASRSRGDGESGVSDGAIRFDLSLRDSYAPRCSEEAVLALADLARRVRVSAHDEADPSVSLLRVRASVDAARFVVCMDVELPSGFKASSDSAIVIEGVSLLGEPVESHVPDSGAPSGFPARVLSLPMDPLELFKACFVRVGRWTIGLVDEGFLVLWNDKEEKSAGWELGESSREREGVVHRNCTPSPRVVELTFGSNGWYRFEIDSTPRIYWSSGPEMTSQTINRPWKSHKLPVVDLTLAALVHLLEVCSAAALVGSSIALCMLRCRTRACAVGTRA